MKLKDLLDKVESYFANKDYTSFETIVSLYEMMPEFKYNEWFLKNFYSESKKLKRVLLTTKKIIDNFKDYLEAKLIVVNDNTYEATEYFYGKFVFNRDSGTILLIIKSSTLKKIKNILIENGYTDEEGFTSTLEKHPSKILLLFMNEIEEKYNTYMNLINKNLSKEEINKIEKIFKTGENQKKDKEKEFDGELNDEEQIEKIIENFLEKFTTIN